jgi:hypothetical protein
MHNDSSEPKMENGRAIAQGEYQATLKPTPEPPPNADGNLIRPDYLSSVATEESQIQIRQFGIIHLFAWITLTAVLLKISQAIGLLCEDGGCMHNPAFPLILVFYLIFYAAGITGLSVLTRTHSLDLEVILRLQPGHWLLILNFLLGICYCLFAIELKMPIVRGVGAFGLTLISILLLFEFFEATRVRDKLPWKILIWLIGAYHFFCCIPVIHVFCILTLFIAVLNDWRSHRPRDWLHWVGIGMLCADAAIWSIFLQLRF